MSISVYGAASTDQNFTPFKDTEANFQSNWSICGQKQYTTDKPLLTSILSPISAPESSPWTISAFTNDPLKVGSHVVTISSSLKNFPGVPSVTVSFTLVVIDDCETAVVQAQSLANMSYVLMYATEPTIQAFLPFSDNVAIKFANEQICGPRLYTILEGYTFIQLSPPASGNEFFDQWTFTLESADMAEIGSYETTIEVRLKNYPSSSPATVRFTTAIMHPCTVTELVPIKL